MICAHPTKPNILATASICGSACVWDIIRGRLLSKVRNKSAFGIPAFGDVRFLPENSCAASLVLSDAIGGLSFVGKKGVDAEPYRASYPQQFFKDDYANLTEDTNHNVVDSTIVVSTTASTRNFACWGFLGFRNIRN